MQDEAALPMACSLFQTIVFRRELSFGSIETRLHRAHHFHSKEVYLRVVIQEVSIALDIETCCQHETYRGYSSAQMH